MKSSSLYSTMVANVHMTFGCHGLKTVGVAFCIGKGLVTLFGILTFPG